MDDGPPLMRRTTKARRRTKKKAVLSGGERRRRERKYTLAAVCDKFNDLADLKAVASLEGARFGYPDARVLCAYDPAAASTVAFGGYLSLDLGGNLPRRVTAVNEEDLRPQMLPPTARFEYIWLVLSQDVADAPGHSNVLVADHEAQRVDRFDPHGYDVAHAGQAGSRFQHFYDEEDLEATVALVMQRRFPHYRYNPDFAQLRLAIPVLGQSISTDAGALHQDAPPAGVAAGPFARRTDKLSGDSFCPAWTLYYLLLRVWNPRATHARLYRYFHFGGDGGAAADAIAKFIVWVHQQYAPVLRSPEYQLSLNDYFGDE